MPYQGLHKGLDPGFTIMNQQEHPFIPIPNPTAGGFSSLTVNRGYYRIIGNQCFWWINVSGTSNATNLTITWPIGIIRYLRVVAPISISYISSRQTYRVDNGTATITGRIDIQPGFKTSACYAALGGTSWTSSGTKAIQASGFFEIGGI